MGSDGAAGHSIWRRVIVPWLLVGLLAPWTWALLTPIPGEVVHRIGGPNFAYLVGKSLHVGVYAALAVLTLALPLSRTWRRRLLVLLVAHGGTTEFLQQFVQRGSSWWDFGIDTLGVALGCGLAALWYRVRSGRLGASDAQVALQREPGGEDCNAADLRQRQV